MTLHMKSKNLILTAILMAVSSTVMAQLIRIISWKETQTQG